MVSTSLIVWPVAPIFLLMHGKDVTIPKETEVTAYISGDVKLDLAKFQPPPLVPASPPVPATQQVSPASPAATPNAGQRLLDLITAMPVDEAAKILRRPVGSVRSMLHRLGMGGKNRT
jgi:hypothetical protein